LVTNAKLVSPGDLMSRKLKIGITIDQETLRMADREARWRKTSRSAFICAAIRAMAGSLDRPSDERTRRKRRLEAVRAIRRLARKAGDWPAEKILHAFRYPAQLFGK
jgi:hypothetical protein